MPALTPIWRNVLAIVLLTTAAFGEEPIKATICQMKSDPSAYNHKLVEVTGFVSHAFEDFTLRDPNCGQWPPVWLEYGGKAQSGTMYCCGVTGSRHRSRELVVEKIPVPLVDDGTFRKFDAFIQPPFSAGRQGAIVQATLVGRFFAGKRQQWGKAASFWGGFGHFGCCSLFAIQQVLAVENDPAITQYASLGEFARQQLRNANAAGFIHVLDLQSGQLTHVASADELGNDPPIALLSVIKVFVAAVWLEHGFGDTLVDCDANPHYPVRHMRVEEVLVSGCDSAGKRMAVLLREKLGAKQVLADLKRFGIERLTVKPDASDEDWGFVLSLGERDVPVTPSQVSRFFAAIGSGGGKLMSAHTAQTLQTSLEAVVQRGTSDSINGALAGTGWRIGGKTGTGPGECGDHCDGWFASLVSDQHGGRYVVLAFIRGKGLGGGVAAHAVAAVAEYLAAHDASTK